MILDMSLILEEITVPPSSARLPKTFKGDHCSDCGAPISGCSRGRCKPCGDAARERGMPTDFRSVLEAKGSSGAAKHYRASLSTITKWRMRLGIKLHTRMARPLRQHGFRGRRGWGTERPILLHLDLTAVGQAADFLRRYGAVYRCNERGGANSKGEFWNRNGRVKTDAEIMHAAERLGWIAVRMF
ncbi:MAG: hypothetical protein GY844_29615 [Bradyrhizobium sp.]|uniref:hypothetical protein n=1 Tax=Sphingomonas sp. VL_57B TaxID=3144220 RepID=UPI0031F4BA12|nr:hypothetical protein [Bradyrhizobium sp.]